MVSITERRAFKRQEFTCTSCEGTGQSKYSSADCECCDGTGIRGRPLYGALVILAYLGGLSALVGWFFLPGH